MRRICYVSGTRADYGLMRKTLAAISESPRLQLDIAVTGMHLLPQYGNTISEIEADGHEVRTRVPVALDARSGASMARAVASQVREFTASFEDCRPDIVLLLGDRGEMLAGAIAGIHLGIVVAHLHGGERSGTVDEPVRHAITKLSHYHLVATAESRRRLIRMGEHDWRIHVVGAPGLDGLRDEVRFDRNELAAAAKLDPRRPIAIVLFHPVLQEADSAGAQTELVLSAVTAAGCQLLCLEPNADAGAASIREVLDRYRGLEGVSIRGHLGRATYLSWLAAADVLVGNSSSGIIEAASFGLPVVNVGSRQQLRQRNANVVDVAPERAAVRRATRQALSQERRKRRNVYGDGRAAQRIVPLLETLPLAGAVMDKQNSY